VFASAAAISIFRLGKPARSVFLCSSIPALHEEILFLLGTILGTGQGGLLQLIQHNSYAVCWLTVLLLSGGVLREWRILVIPLVACVTFDLYFGGVFFSAVSQTSFASSVQIASWGVTSAAFVLSFYVIGSLKTKQLGFWKAPAKILCVWRTRQGVRDATLLDTALHDGRGRIGQQ
jgi:hypothetical protein